MPRGGLLLGGSGPDDESAAKEDRLRSRLRGMGSERSRHALLRVGTQDAPQISRALGVLLLCGAVLAMLALSQSGSVSAAGLYGVGAVAVLIGGASLVWAEHARTWTVHAAFATGSALVCAGVYFSGTATGAYAVLFVWLVVTAASFFSVRAIIAHVVWILVASAVALGLVDAPPDVSPITRWIFGSLLLVIAAAVMSQIAAGRRSVEEQLRSEIEEKARLQRELEHLANHDPLTGLANRRRFELELARELARATRQNAPLCLVALDLDGFKEFNDHHGHLAGDRLLKRSASAWTAAVRAVDMIARLGGDEFVVLLPACRPAEAERVVDRLRRGVPLGLTCSAGIACWDGRESAERLLTRADKAMYEAKKRVAGRGAVRPPVTRAGRGMLRSPARTPGPRI